MLGALPTDVWDRFDVELRSRAVLPTHVLLVALLVPNNNSIVLVI